LTFFPFTLHSIAVYDAEIETLRKKDQNYLESFETWCCRRTETSWLDHVRNVLHRVKEERNILHKIKRRNDNWIGLILRRNCLVKRVIEENRGGRIEGTVRRRRKRKQLLDDFK
jgi:hypothetical protein